MPAHLDDLASDFSAIHRVGDMWSLPGPVFFRLAFRLGAYQGVIQARMAEQMHEQAPSRAAQAPAWGQPQAGVNPGTRESLEAMQAQLQRDAPGTPQLFSFSTFKRTG